MGVLRCLVPSFRDDVEGRADLAEEVMRIYGYDHIVGTPITGAVVRGRRLPERIKADRIKELLCGAGMREITTYSFISSKATAPLRLSADDPRQKAITILNPLGDEYSTMRTQLITSMLSVVATNINRKNSAGGLLKWDNFTIRRHSRPRSSRRSARPCPSACLVKMRIFIP